MGKFGCTCGNVLSDVSCPNEVTGSVFSDKSCEAFFNDLILLINEGCDYERRGEIRGWRDKVFGAQYPKDLPLGEMLHDLIHTRFCDLTLAIWECDQCGRLWIQEKVGENRYREYVAGVQDGIRLLGLNQRAE